MNRRTFGRSAAGALLAGLSSASGPQNVSRNSRSPASTSFDVSVMLWTVFRDLPFEQRLEKVAAAGYRNVELVGEYANWSSDDFDRANAKRKELGIAFDCTAGLKHSLCNPADRDGLIEELRRTLPIMERLDCPAIILLTGNVVPGMSVEVQHQSCVDGLKAAAQLVYGRKI